MRTLSWTDPVDRSFTGNLQNRLLLRVVTVEGSFLGDAGSNTQRVVIPKPGNRRIAIEIEGLEVYVPSFGTTSIRQKFAWSAGNAVKLKAL